MKIQQDEIGLPQLITLLFIILSICSCKSEIECALSMADDNRKELERVIDYFKKTGDREKLTAAEYIIKYMPGHKSMHGSCWSYYDAADSVLSGNGQADDILEKLHQLSLEYSDSISFLYDINCMNADFLIHDISKAIEQWREGEWSRHLSFDEFCEWLLPYSCSDSQPIFNWRDSLEHFAEGYIAHLNECEDYLNNPRAAIVRVNDKLKDMIPKQKWIHSEHGYPIFKPEIFIKLPGAKCDEYADIATLVMRSKGIPVGIDFTPQWPDRLYGHSWCVFPTLRGKTSMFNPFASNPDYPHYSHALFAKVFRRTYRPNEDFLSLIRRNNGHVPNICHNVFFKDVTEEYMRTADLTVKLDYTDKIQGKDVYIAVFDNFDWRPVYWGRRRGNKAYFKDMGCNITYIVLGYNKEDDLVPLSNPFTVDYTGTPVYIKPESDRLVSFRLFRKYPMFQHVFLVHSYLHGGRFEGSETPYFDHSEIVSSFSEWSLTSGYEKVLQSKPYRYWRFCADSGSVADMAEIFLYDTSAGKPLAEFHLSNQKDSFANLFDGNPLTYCSVSDTCSIGYIDFGRPTYLDHISYIRRGDGNAITPGDVYEIYYWDKGNWILHSKEIAKDIYIDVSNIPYGVLYYIKGLSRGVQNRIFTWDEVNEKVKWQ